MIEQDLPLLRKTEQGWEPKFQFSPPQAPKDPIKRKCPTSEAQVRFLGVRGDAGILNSHASKTEWNSQIPYRYRETEGEWLFFFVGKGKTNRGRITNLWDVYFISQKQIDSAA
jgi:hypothetical protein